MIDISPLFLVLSQIHISEKDKMELQMILNFLKKHRIKLDLEIYFTTKKFTLNVFCFFLFQSVIFTYHIVTDLSMSLCFWHVVVIVFERQFIILCFHKSQNKQIPK